ncbi:MAG: glycine cleavage system protein GcvH [Planctomycetes bacterium]|nr:glycine cleavage system protein GcvH [Planctomycetota bacterium]
MRPDNTKFAQTHEWVAVKGDVATVGLTDFAVQQLSDLVFIDLPKVGQEVKQGEPFGEVESVKAVSDLNAPVSGEVTDINENLASNLDAVAKEPFGSGWFVKIKMSAPDEINKLLSSADYDKHCESEDH